VIDIDLGCGEAPAIVDRVEQRMAIVATVGKCGVVKSLPGFVDLP
jgi:hypothetical protein